MSPYLHFVLSFGALLALMCVIAAWLFRTANAPLWAKIALPVAALALGCYAPVAVGAIMGFPVSAGVSALPDHAQLVAFVAHDEEGQVDLWLQTDNVPRAYETRLTKEMKKTLRQAQDAMARGQRAVLAKRGTPGRNGVGDRLGIGDDQGMYELDRSALSALPAKM
ncbi:MAG: hypothetical protein JO107_10535 [Hyphomicrobiales bacterium]|nr:hypothetical protein [Hyphomicrobiales bacterium]MBV8663527.1 hypothetical protein [Hyphomicrobiales bacterium]